MTATATTPSIDADTTVYTFSADFAGYSTIEGFLGDQSCGDWVRAGELDEATEIAAIITTITDGLGESYFLSEKDAEEYADENEIRAFMKVESFSPRSVRDEIIEHGQKEIAEAESESDSE